jgi:hypothetical protein
MHTIYNSPWREQPQRERMGEREREREERPV